MQRIALGVEYEGALFSGWQKQPDLPTVQGYLERAIAEVVGMPVDVVSAGRTDAGVHACNQVVHFTSPVPRPLAAWTKGLNTSMPKSVRVRWAKEVDDTFHARFSATARRYLYLLIQDQVSPGIGTQGITWVHYPLDVQKMILASQYLIGTHDFTSFRDGDCQAHSPIRTLQSFHIHAMGKWVICDIKANAFLHHMVRNMMGLLMAIGRGWFEPDHAKTVLEARSRMRACSTAPANGLYLYQVDYPEHFQLPPMDYLPWGLEQLRPVIEKCSITEIERA